MLKDLLRAFSTITLDEQPRRAASLPNDVVERGVDEAGRITDGGQQPGQPLSDNVKLLSELKCTNAKRDEVVSQLYRLFNETVFDGKLPRDMKVAWNPRLIKTAGYCKCKRTQDTMERYCVIFLSSKICDTAGRIRDTLLHEMCHAAAWLIDKTAEGHGIHWRKWCARANHVYPEIPIITTRHSYQVATKFAYECSKCSNRRFTMLACRFNEQNCSTVLGGSNTV
uniref:SprT-like domain-containing protein n=1 Tax=Trichuris muris TaxID=70415 RepID=A0A5S6QT35_TRIMR